MLEIIRNINNSLEYQYQFAIDRTPLYDKTKVNIYPTVDVYFGFIIQRCRSRWSPYY